MADVTAPNNPVQTSTVDFSGSQLQAPPPPATAAEMNQGVDISQPAPTTPAVQPPVAPDHHSAFGRAAKAVLGAIHGGGDVTYQADANGQLQPVPVPHKPGDIFRHILAGAILGGAAGAGADSLVRGGAVGGAAVQRHAEEQDMQARQLAQQNYENRLRAAQEQRAESSEKRAQAGFETEEKYKNAQMTMLNTQKMHLIQTMQQEGWKFHQDMSSTGKEFVQAYQDSGIMPKYSNITETEAAKIFPTKQNLDWQPVGVKAVVRPDGSVGYEELFNAYDLNQKIRLTPQLVSRFKSVGLDSNPSWANTIKPGYEVTPTQMIGLQSAYDNAFRKQYTESKAKLDLEKERVEIANVRSEIAKRSKDAKEQESFSSAADRWTKVQQEKKISAAEAFGQLSAGDQAAIGKNMVPMLNAYLNDVKVAEQRVKDNPGDVDAQRQYSEARSQYEDMKKFASQPYATPTPPPAAAGAPAPASGPTPTGNKISASDVELAGPRSLVGFGGVKDLVTKLGLAGPGAIADAINAKPTIKDKADYIANLPTTDGVKQQLYKKSGIVLVQSPKGVIAMSPSEAQEAVKQGGKILNQ